MNYRRQSGVALLEALIATLLLAVGLLGAIGMQARAVSALADAGMRAEATMASEKLVAQMTLDQANLASYAYSGTGTPGAAVAGWVTATRNAIPGAAVAVAVAAVPATTRSAVTVTISWLRKTGGQANTHVVTSYIANSQ